MTETKDKTIDQIFVIFLILFIAGGVYAVSGQQKVSPLKCVMYDWFSGSSLNLTKWKEVPGSDTNSLFVDEHYVNPSEGRYHTAQLTPADKGVTLEMLRYKFNPGEIATFDLYYHSGSGNQISVVDINNATKWIGLVGYWNEVEPGRGGNELGRYRFTVRFADYGADIYIRQPNGTVIKVPDFPQTPGTSHSFGFGTRTGHNGVTHRDYDNVRVCRFG